MLYFFINGVIYFLIIGMIFVCITSGFQPNKLPSTIMNFSIGLFFLALLINTIIQNRTYDKKFRIVLEENKHLIFSLSSADFVINCNLLRAMCYGGGASYSCKWVKVRALNEMSNYLSSLPEFIKTTKNINIFSAWFALSSVFILFAGSCVAGIYNYVT